MKDIVIQGKKVNYGLEPLVIAEAGVNHEGDMTLAKRLVAEAKEGGADSAYKVGAAPGSPPRGDGLLEPATRSDRNAQQLGDGRGDKLIDHRSQEARHPLGEQAGGALRAALAGLKQRPAGRQDHQTKSPQSCSIRHRDILPRGSDFSRHRPAPSCRSLIG